MQYDGQAPGFVFATRALATRSGIGHERFRDSCADKSVPWLDTHNIHIPFSVLIRYAALPCERETAHGNRREAEASFHRAKGSVTRQLPHGQTAWTAGLRVGGSMRDDVTTTTP